MVWAFLFASATSLKAQYVTQTLPLQPGWNAVWVEVDPTPAELDTLFENTAVLGVYGWVREMPERQFEIDPNTPLPPAAHWRVWKPVDRFPDQAPLNTLFAFEANRAYMIEVDAGADPITLPLLGEVRAPRIEWLPFAFNLVGFPVSEATPPTFSELLGPSGAFNLEQKVPGHLYSIRSDGGSTQIDQRNGPEFIRANAGEAYWVRAGNPQGYTAPLDFPGVSDVRFGSTTSWAELPIRNHRSTPMQVRLSYRASDPAPAGEVTPSAVPLAYYGPSVSESLTDWETFPAGGSITFTVEAESTLILPIAIRRDQLVQGGGPYASYLEMTDVETASLRVRLPLTASDDPNGPGLANPFQGLWVGEAALGKVSAPYFNGDTPLPVKDAFGLRLLVHVDHDGQARLLQSVMVGLVPAGLDPNGEPAFTYALWSGRNPTLPADTVEARRISSTGFPVMDPLDLTGDFTAGLSGQLVIEANDPQNPFLHTFHPDHDNRDADFNSFGTNPVEVPKITRAIHLTFTPPAGDTTSSIFGVDRRAGTFRERIQGLRDEDVVVEGTFLLRRLIPLGELQP